MPVAVGASSTARDLLTGIAQMIADSGIGVYRTAGAYASNETAVVFKSMPSSPDRAIVLTAVPMTDQVFIPMGMVLVQARCRGVPGDPLDVDDLGDAVFDLLHGLKAMTLGSVHIIQCLRNSSVPMGQDSSRRSERIDHFYIDLDYAPTTNRPAGGWD